MDQHKSNSIKKIHLDGNFQAKQFVRTICQPNSLTGIFVEHLYMEEYHFTPHEKNCDPNNYVAKIIKFCPNVETLEIPSFPTTARLLLQAREKGCLQHVRTFGLDHIYADFFVASKFALAFHITTSILNLQDGSAYESPTLKKAYVQQYNKIMDVYKEFGRVYELTIEVFTKKSIYKLETYFEKFPLVRGLTYVPYRGTTRRLEDVHDEGVIEDLANIKPQTTLKEFFGR